MLVGSVHILTLVHVAECVLRSRVVHTLLRGVDRSRHPLWILIKVFKPLRVFHMGIRQQRATVVLLRANPKSCF